MTDLPSFLLPVLGGVLGALVGQVISRRFARVRETEAPDRGREVSVECGARLRVGAHPHLRRRSRLGRAVVRRGAAEIALFRWGVRWWRQPAFRLDVASVDRTARRAGWWASLNASVPVRVVTAQTTDGLAVELLLPTDAVDTVLDVLEGLPSHAPSAPSHDAQPQLPHGWVWSTEREVRVTSRALVDGDAASQLHWALDEVERQLHQHQVPLSGIERLQVLTTDAHAVRGCIPALAQRLRTAGATPTITVLAVDRLPAPGQVVELDATASTT